MTREQLEQEAHYSNFGGNYETNYSGVGDDMLDFAGGSKGFEEFNYQRSFTLTLVNANAASRIALVMPGYNWGLTTNPTGTIATGAFNDTGGNAGLTGSGSPSSIETLLAFIAHNPIRVLGIKFVSDVASQVEQLLSITKLSPFKTGETQNFPLAATQDENTYKDKVSTVKFKDLQFDNQTQFSIPVVGSSTLTMTIFFGAILNTAAALNAKFQRSIK